jgi:O-antigen ligase
MRAKAQKPVLKPKSQDRAGEATYWLTLSLIVGLPLVFSTALYRMYSAPKFSLLLTGAAALAPLLTWTVMRTPDRWGEIRCLFASRHVLFVILYLIVIVISTVLGVSPVASLFGSSYGQMGLLTRLCFFIVFVSLIAVVARSEKRFHAVLWAMTLTGLAVATYAFMQFFGKDPFIQSRLYTFESEGGALLRVNSTIGHSNYLGNFLLYVAPLGAGLGLASRGRARRAGLTAATLSVLAIIFTGTRGAWLGLVVAGLAFVMLLRSSRTEKVSEHRRRKIIWRAGIVALAALVLFAIVSVSPAYRSIVLRARSLVHENTGAGRTLLWRDSMKMVKDYALIGCGPEGFRKAFLPYKSDELARLAPETNNESSHNSFIDAALSYGLLGAILYVAIIASSFSLLLRARRRAADASSRIIASTLVASLAAVVVHNFFIFDQISTGLYFFVFAGLAQIASNKVALGNEQARYESRRPSSQTKARRLAPMVLVVASGIFVIAAWYSIENILADIEINKALASAQAGSFAEVVEHGNRATSYPDPAGDYRMLLAQCLTRYSDAIGDVAAKSTQLERAGLNETRKRAVTLAMFHAEQTLARTLTPDSNCVLLAYLAFRLGDSDKLFTYASEAVRIDPRFSNSHWLMAEAYLGNGDREAAESEARLALYLNPHSPEARSAFNRARGTPMSTDSPEKLIQYARALAGRGLFEKARRVLLRAIRKSEGQCAECHSALASLCEGAGLYAEAISEWEAYEREAPEQALAEKTASRIERLRRRQMQVR